MNQNWRTFLATRDLKQNPAGAPDGGSDSSTATPAVSQTCGYAVLAVTGRDAAAFLQGQTTCDVLGLQPNSATHGAICNPKGRVLSTFLLFIHEDGYWLVLPETLAVSIEKKLRMHVLRSKVGIENVTDSVAIFGQCCASRPERFERTWPESSDRRYPLVHAENWQMVKTAPNQWLFIGSAESAEQHWNELVALDGYAETSCEYWNLLCILNGIPRLGIETSEEFIPQMINLDALGGISFKKGCYTGQEIVARTHYLGKLKRRMFLAATRSDQLPGPGDPLFVSGNEQSIGQVVNAAWLHRPELRLLIVLQIEQTVSGSIHLPDPLASPLKILELPYTL
ncbi:MAG: folate-binding protein [Methylococcaceae bacterium]|nr:folate-binding protein [Methylococcaceae bacterium]MCI0733542.1 folate-binding protein [Methylococcaceae bacterium]